MFVKIKLECCRMQILFGVKRIVMFFAVLKLHISVTDKWTDTALQ